MKNINDPRHQARRLALAYLYSYNLNPEKQDISYYTNKLKIAEFDNKLFNLIVDAYIENIEQLNSKTMGFLASWSSDQLLELDILIIKIAILEYEILKTVPVKVAVDEAVELAKEFSAEKSGKFVNGVLAKIIAGSEK